MMAATRHWKYVLYILFNDVMSFLSGVGSIRWTSPEKAEPGTHRPSFFISLFLFCRRFDDNCLDFLHSRWHFCWNFSVKILVVHA